MKRIFGPAKGLKVYPGDVIDMEVWARYNEVNSNEVSAEAFLFSALMPTLGISATGETSQAYSAFDNLICATSLVNQHPGDRPAAYLNYIFFDNNYQSSVIGFERVSTSAASAHEMLTLSKSITTEGYIYIYVSNESTLNLEVYFDDLKITHTSESMVVQANDYYPFGLTMKPSDFQREGELENKFLYNGKELQDDLGLDVYDYGLRMYDPTLGRWHVQDILSEKHFDYTSYNYCQNNPLLYIDVAGADTSFANNASSQAFKDAYSKVGKAKSSITRKLNKKKEKLEKKGNSKRSEKSIQKTTKKQDEISLVESAFNFIINSSTMFHFEGFTALQGADGSVIESGGSSKWNSSTDRYEISFYNTKSAGGTMVHEMRHGIGYLTHEFGYETDPTTGQTSLRNYDYMDEFEGFRFGNYYKKHTKSSGNTFSNDKAIVKHIITKYKNNPHLIKSFSQHMNK